MVTNILYVKETVVRENNMVTNYTICKRKGGKRKHHGNQYTICKRKGGKRKHHGNQYTMMFSLTTFSFTYSILVTMMVFSYHPFPFYI